MWEAYYQELEQAGDGAGVRENVSLLRQAAKDPAVRDAVRERAKDGALLIGFLESREPKVRKNAALLLGDLAIAPAADALFAAYQKEGTRFVRSAYLTALGKLDASPYCEALAKQRDLLNAYEPAEEERKHVLEELRALDAILVRQGGEKRHTFAGFSEPHDVLLTVGQELREVTLAGVAAFPASLRRTASLHPLGVLVRTKELRRVASLRTYRELLFPIRLKKEYGREEAPGQLAEAVWRSDLPGLLAEICRGDAPFSYRIALPEGWETAARSRFARDFSDELSRLSQGRFVNSTDHYEMELRLMPKVNGGFGVFLRLTGSVQGMPPDRFAYRRHAVSGSMHPALAAAVMELAKPYLKEGAQVLDPFCGVGTLLIERDYCVPAGDKYGIDLYGKAVDMARENAAAAGEQIRFVNRDFATFGHRYLFDEIVTDMPVRGKDGKEALDALYGMFFEKAKELLTPGAVIVMCSGEEGFVKKQLRLHGEFRLAGQHRLRNRDGFGMFIIRYKG